MLPTVLTKRVCPRVRLLSLSSTVPALLFQTLDCIGILYVLVERLNKKGKKERERKEEEEGEKKRKKEEEERREGFECSMLSPVWQGYF